MPVAQPRRSGGNAAFIRASASGMTKAAPATVNSPSPAAKTRRRPYRSPRAAPVISSTAKQRTYALTVHSRSSNEAPRSRWIVLKAVATTSMSSTTMNEARALSPRTQRCVAVLFVMPVVTPQRRETGRRPVSGSAGVGTGEEDAMVTDQLVSRAMAGDDEAFRALVEPHRRELHVHCYRILGSVQDAEDVLQETLVAAWRGLSGYEGRASVRAWLYRIATNRCLNALRDGQRRPKPVPTFAAGVLAPEPTRTVDPIWLQPFPDALLEGLPDAAPGPEARYERREAISLAFVTAMQSLPPRQRAVLVLRDVLGFRAAEVADMLNLTEDAVTSALKRARAGLPDTDRDRTPLPGSAQERALAGRFADAVERGDVEAMVALLTEDAWLTMPPAPMQYQGVAAIAVFMRDVGFRQGTRRYRLLPTAANGQPAYGCYISDYEDPVWHAHGMLVVTLVGDRVSAMTRFIDNSVLPYFALPRTMH